VKKQIVLLSSLAGGSGLKDKKAPLGQAGDFPPISPAACYANGNFIVSPKKDLMTEKSNKYQANDQFAKLQRSNDAKKAMSDYESAAVALRAKTERLKALRMARDAAAPQPATPKQKAKKKDKGPLSEFLAGQAKEGRNG
jgi:hypothetical protein